MTSQADGAPRVDVAALGRLLGEWDVPGRSLPEALADALAELIDASVVADGAVLPSQRRLAEALGVARGTVAEAYDRLAGDGHLHARRGSGSRVRRRPGLRGPGTVTEGRLASFRGAPAGVLDLSSGALPGLPAVARAWADLDPAALGPLVAGDGYFPAGVPELREAVARRLTADGLSTAPGQVLVTSGAQHGVWLLADNLVSPGDEVVVEEPSYRGALEAFRACGARLVPVPVRDDGLDVEHLDRVLQRSRPAVVYLQPTAHNPTGTTVPPGRRAALADVLARSGATVVEDACSADLTVDGTAPAPLVAGLPPDRAVLVGTASKLLWAGLRVGWVRASPGVVARLGEARKAVDLAGPVVDQLVTARLLDDAPAARAARRSGLAASRAEVEALLRQHHPGWTWPAPAGGTGLWVDTHDDAVAVAERGARRGVRIVAGPAFSAVGGLRGHLRVPLGRPADVVDEALRRLRPDARD